MLSVLNKSRSWRLACGAARGLVAGTELNSDMRPGPRVRFSSSGMLGSGSVQTYTDYLQQNPNAVKLQRTLGEEMMMSLPVSQSHEVLRVGKFAFTVDGATNDVYRVPISYGEDIQEPELIFRVEDVRPGAQVTGIRRSRCGTMVIVMLVEGGLPHVYLWEEGASKVVYQEHVQGAMGIEFGCAEKGTLVYTAADTLGRPSRVVMTSVVRAQGPDTVPHSFVVFEDRNPAHFVGLQRTKDWSHLIINAVAKTSSEAFILDEANGTTRSVQPRHEGVVYAIEHVGGDFVMMSDRCGENALYARNKTSAAAQGARGGTSDADEWRAMYAPQNDSTFLEDISVNMNGIVALERDTKTGLPVVRVLPLSSSPADVVDLSAAYVVPIPDFALDCQFGANEDFASDRVELEIRSPIIPTMRVQFDVTTRATYVMTHSDMDDDSVLIENNLSNYTAMRMPLTVGEGHVVPLTLAYRNDATNPSPALWIVYGAYGECLDMSYAPHLMPLMNRGYKIIWCHVRGGGELGRTFYDQGRRRHLANRAADLRACMAFLKKKNVTSQNAIYSYSAGALAACGAMDLADAVILESPFVDLADAMRDVSHPLTIHEYDEFGNPNEREDMETMQRVCPLTNVRQTIGSSQGPPVLVCTGKDDDHVSKDAITRFSNTVGGVIWENAYAGHLPETMEELAKVRAGAHAFLLNSMPSS